VQRTTAAPFCAIRAPERHSFSHCHHPHPTKINDLSYLPQRKVLKMSETRPRGACHRARRTQRRIAGTCVGEGIPVGRCQTATKPPRSRLEDPSRYRWHWLPVRQHGGQHLIQAEPRLSETIWLTNGEPSAENVQRWSRKLWD
jgi:hypothetical protein